MIDTIQNLDARLDQRKRKPTAQSYTCRLHEKGLDAILKKVGEEATETVMAAKDSAHSGDVTALIAETADLWYHTLVMLSHLGTNGQAVLNELDRRAQLKKEAGKKAQ